MLEFTRWNRRILLAILVMVPILLILQLFNCIPESPAPAQEPNPKILKSFDDQVPLPGAPIMKVQNPLMSRLARGTLGHQLIYRGTPRGTAAYLHFKPKQPGTEAQQNHQILFALLADRWTAFTQAEKDFWIPAGQAAWITPYNAFMKYNLARLNPAQPEGLIGWWPNVLPAGEILHDLSADHNDGEFVSLYPHLAWPPDQRRRGNVIEYDGAGYVNVPSPPSSLSEYTWAFWFKQNAYTGGSAIVDTGWAAHYVQARFSAQRCTHRLRAVTAMTPQMFLTDFTWNHYAGTFLGTNIEIYINGNLHHIVPGATAPTPNAYMRFGIHNIGVPPIGFRGRVDDLRFYNRRLTGPQIAELL